MHFKCIITGDQVREGKPSPEIYLKAYRDAGFEEMGIQREQCLVVEDAPIGVQAVLSAGMDVVWVPEQNQSSSQSSNQSSNQVISQGVDSSRVQVLPSLTSFNPLDYFQVKNDFL